MTQKDANERVDEELATDLADRLERLADDLEASIVTLVRGLLDPILDGMCPDCKAKVIQRIATIASEAKEGDVG